MSQKIKFTDLFPNNEKQLIYWLSDGVKCTPYLNSDDLYKGIDKRTKEVPDDEKGTHAWIISEQLVPVYMLETLFKDE